MAVRGWYPDPGGRPGLFRYFDGAAWTPHTTRNPADPLPGGRPEGRAPRNWAPLIIGVAAALVLIVIAAFVIWNPFDDDGVPTSTSTVSGWDDSSPIASPTPTPSDAPSRTGKTPRDVDTPDPESSTSAEPVACDVGGADELPTPEQDGRVHGGPLSFERLSDWKKPRPSNRFFFSHDSYVQELVLPEDLPWAASVQVGVLDPLPGKPDAAETTQLLLQCLTSSDFYTSVDVVVTKNETQKTTIDSAAATQLDAVLEFEHPQLTTTGSNIRIIVVDSEPQTYYFHAVPKERDDLIKQLDGATASLTVD